MLVYQAEPCPQQPIFLQILFDTKVTEGNKTNE